MRGLDLFVGMALLAAVALYGSTGRGTGAFTGVFLGLTIIALLSARNSPRGSLYVIAVGTPLLLTVNREPLFLLAVAALVLGLALRTGNALRTRGDGLHYAAAVLLTLPVVLLIPLVPNTLVLAIALGGGAVLIAVVVSLLSLRMQIQFRGDAG